jgi:hypothetical protein
VGEIEMEFKILATGGAEIVHCEGIIKGAIAAKWNPRDLSTDALFYLWHNGEMTFIDNKKFFDGDEDLLLYWENNIFCKI